MNQMDPGRVALPEENHNEQLLGCEVENANELIMKKINIIVAYGKVYVDSNTFAVIVSIQNGKRCFQNRYESSELSSLNSVKLSIKDGDDLCKVFHESYEHITEIQEEIKILEGYGIFGFKVMQQPFIEFHSTDYSFYNDFKLTLDHQILSARNKFMNFSILNIFTHEELSYFAILYQQKYFKQAQGASNSSSNHFANYIFALGGNIPTIPTIPKDQKSFFAETCYFIDACIKDSDKINIRSKLRIEVNERYRKKFDYIIHMITYSVKYKKVFLITVPQASHIFHVSAPIIYKIIDKVSIHRLIFCSSRTRIKAILDYIKGSASSHPVFIIHPEFLSAIDFSQLHEFVKDRLNKPGSEGSPVIIFTSDTSFEALEASYDLKEEDVEEFSRLSKEKSVVFMAQNFNIKFLQSKDGCIFTDLKNGSFISEDAPEFRVPMKPGSYVVELSPSAFRVCVEFWDELFSLLYFGYARRTMAPPIIGGIGESGNINIALVSLCKIPFKELDVPNPLCELITVSSPLIHFENGVLTDISSRDVLDDQIQTKLQEQFPSIEFSRFEKLQIRKYVEFAQERFAKLNVSNTFVYNFGPSFKKFCQCHSSEIIQILVASAVTVLGLGESDGAFDYTIISFSDLLISREGGNSYATLISNNEKILKISNKLIEDMKRISDNNGEKYKLALFVAEQKLSSMQMMKLIASSISSDESYIRQAEALKAIDLIESDEFRTKYDGGTLSYESEEMRVLRSLNISTDFQERGYIEFQAEAMMKAKLQNADPVSQISLSTQLVVRTISVIQRLACMIPTIMEGETGCGKTSAYELIKYLYDMSPEGKRSPTFEFVRKIVNSDFSRSDFMSIVNQSKNRTRVLFFDECNTSRAGIFIEREMLNPISDKSIRFIGAINPLVKSGQISQELSMVGLHQKLISESATHLLVNRAKELSEIDHSSMKYHVFASLDSSKVIALDFNKKKVNEEDDDILPKEERESFENFSRNYILCKHDKPSDPLIKYPNILVECVRFIRALTDERAKVSYRDLKKSHKILEEYLRILGAKYPTEAVLLSLYTTFGLSLPENLGPISKEVSNHFKRMNSEYIDVLPANEGDFVHIRDIFCKFLVRKWNEQTKITYEASLSDEFTKAAYFNLWDFINREKMLRFTSTIENIFFLKVVEESELHAFIIGMPGTSKTFSAFKLEHIDQSGNAPKLCIVPHMCSRTSSPVSIKSIFLDAYLWKVLDNRTKPYILYDEFDLANLNTNKLPNYLHDILDFGIDIYPSDPIYIPSIGISNFTADKATIGRGVVRFCDSISKNDFIESLSLKGAFLGAKPAEYKDFENVWKHYKEQRSSTDVNVTKIFEKIWVESHDFLYHSLRSTSSLYEILTEHKIADELQIISKDLHNMSDEMRRSPDDQEQISGKTLRISEDLLRVSDDLRRIPNDLQTISNDLHSISDNLIDTSGISPTMFDKLNEISNRIQQISNNLGAKSDDIRCTNIAGELFNSQHLSSNPAAYLDLIGNANRLLSELEYHQSQNVHFNIDILSRLFIGDKKDNEIEKSVCVVSSDYSICEFLSEIRFIEGLSLPFSRDGSQFKNGYLGQINPDFYFESDFSMPNADVCKRQLDRSIESLTGTGREAKVPIYIGNPSVLDFFHDFLNHKEEDDENNVTESKMRDVFIGYDGFSKKISVSKRKFIVLITSIDRLDPNGVDSVPIPLLDRFQFTFLDWLQICPLILYYQICEDKSNLEEYMNDLCPRTGNTIFEKLQEEGKEIQHLLDAEMKKCLGEQTETLQTLFAEEINPIAKISNPFCKHFNSGSRAVIITNSNIQEEIILEGVKVIDDNAISCEEDFDRQLEGNQSKGFLVKCKKYDEVHDEHLKYCIGKSDLIRNKPIFIIYYRANTEKLRPTMKWPVFAIDDIGIALREDLRNIPIQLMNWSKGSNFDLGLISDVIISTYKEILLNFRFSSSVRKSENIKEFSAKLEEWIEFLGASKTDFCSQIANLITFSSQCEHHSLVESLIPKSVASMKEKFISYAKAQAYFEDSNPQKLGVFGIISGILEDSLFTEYKRMGFEPKHFIEAFKLCSDDLMLAKILSMRTSKEPLTVGLRELRRSIPFADLLSLYFASLISNEDISPEDNGMSKIRCFLSSISTPNFITNLHAQINVVFNYIRLPTELINEIVNLNDLHCVEDIFAPFREIPGFDIVKFSKDYPDEACLIYQLNERQKDNPNELPKNADYDMKVKEYQAPSTSVTIESLINKVKSFDPQLSFSFEAESLSCPSSDIFREDSMMNLLIPGKSELCSLSDFKYAEWILTFNDGDCPLFALALAKAMKLKDSASISNAISLLTFRMRNCFDVFSEFLTGLSEKVKSFGKSNFTLSEWVGLLSTVPICDDMASSGKTDPNSSENVASLALASASQIPSKSAKLRILIYSFVFNNYFSGYSKLRQIVFKLKMQFRSELPYFFILMHFTTVDVKCSDLPKLNEFGVKYECEGSIFVPFNGRYPTIENVMMQNECEYISRFNGISEKLRSIYEYSPISLPSSICMNGFVLPDLFSNILIFNLKHSQDSLARKTSEYVQKVDEQLILQTTEAKRTIAHFIPPEKYSIEGICGFNDGYKERAYKALKKQTFIEWLRMESKEPFYAEVEREKSLCCKIAIIAYLGSFHSNGLEGILPCIIGSEDNNIIISQMKSLYKKYVEQKGSVADFADWEISADELCSKFFVKTPPSKLACIFGYPRGS